MSESILRLKVSSEEYDNKLKRATEQLSRYADGFRKAGGTLQYVDDNVVEFTRSLGKMETTATTARGKVSELTKAYTELAVRYKKMTDEEKKGEYGKALAQSLNELKGRIRETKNDLDDVNKSISGSGGLTGALDAVAGKFGLSIEQLTKFGGVAAIATTAINVAKDAFFANELTVDEWGRTMEASKSLYEGFLNALNTGDISGYLNNMGQIVNAAREAYNELDKFGTMQTIQKPLISAQQTENDRIRQMIMTKRYIAPLDGRRNAVFNGKPMVNGQLLTDGQVRMLERQLNGGINKVVSMVGREIKQSNKAIDAVYNRFAKENGMSISEFRKGTSSWDDFDERMQGYAKYEKWRSKNYYTDNWGNRRVKEGNPYQQYKNWGVFRVDGNRYNKELVNLILQRDQQEAQAYGMQSQAFRTVNRAEGITSRVGGGRSGGSRSSNTSISEEQSNNQAIQKLTQEYVQATEERQEAIRDEIKALQERNAVIKQMKDEALGKYSPIEPMGEAEGIMPGFYSTPTKSLQSAQLSIKTPLQALEEELKNLTAFRDASMTSGDWQNRNFLVQAKQQEISGYKGETQKKEEDEMKKLTNKISSLTSGISSITGGLQSMGVELPKGLQETISVINGLMAIVQGVSTVISIFSTGAETANTVATTANTIALGAMTTALYANTAVSAIPFFRGGGIAHAARGFVPGNDHNDNTAVSAIPFFRGGGIAHAARGFVPGNDHNDNTAVSAIPFFRGGGIAHAARGFVPGNDHNDNIPVMVSSGELILNRAQQGNLASQLEGGGLNGMQLHAVITGEQLRLVLNNNSRRTGRGEYVTTNFMRS